MWWDHSEPLEVYLSDNEVGCRLSSSTPVDWVDTSGSEQALQHVAAWLDGSTGLRARRVCVWLSASLAQPFLVPALSGARNKREVAALAKAMTQDATGMDGEARLWLDRWRPGDSTLAVAIPADIWKRLHDIIEAGNDVRKKTPRQLRPSRLALVSVRPAWNLPFDTLLAESRSAPGRMGWSLTDGASILHGVVDQGRVTAIGFDRHAPHDPAGTLLRRRIQVNWGLVSTSQHLVFERQAGTAETQPFPIGAWGRLPEGIA